MLRRLEPGAYYGATTRLHDGEGLSVGETVFAPDLAIPQHEHERSFICFVLEGLGTRSWPARAGREAPMSLTVFPAGVPHANQWHGGGGRALHLEFAPGWLARLEGRTRVLEEPGDFTGGPPAWLLGSLVRECREPDGVTPLVVEGLVLEMLAACDRLRGGKGVRSVAPPWLGRVQEVMRDRFREDLTIAEIAVGAGVSADHLARVFRRHFGCAPGEHLRRLRIGFACERLAEGRESLADIALAAGFADQSHFTRVFRRQVGITPAAFRRGKR